MDGVLLVFAAFPACIGCDQSLSYLEAAVIGEAASLLQREHL